MWVVVRLWLRPGVVAGGDSDKTAHEGMIPFDGGWQPITHMHPV